MHVNVVFANLTEKVTTMRLQYSFLSLIYACCTKIVKWLALLHAWLNGVSKRPGRKLKKNIALHLTYPVFNGKRHLSTILDGEN